MSALAEAARELEDVLLHPAHHPTVREEHDGMPPGRHGLFGVTEDGGRGRV
jgi:hypothetical protein